MVTNDKKIPELKELLLLEVVMLVIDTPLKQQKIETWNFNQCPQYT